MESAHCCLAVPSAPTHLVSFPVGVGEPPALQPPKPRGEGGGRQVSCCFGDASETPWAAGQLVPVQATGARGEIQDVPEAEAEALPSLRVSICFLL